MFTKKIKFTDKKSQSELRLKAKSNFVVNNAIDELERIFNDITVTDYQVLGDEHIVLMDLLDNTNVKAKVNVLYRTMDINSDDWDYTIKYQILKNSCNLLGKEYNKNNRQVLCNHSFNDKIYSFIYKDESNFYEINIIKTVGLIDHIAIIYKLLECKQVTRIKDVLEVIKDYVNLENIELNIRGNAEKVSNIIIYHGVITRYVEYLMKENGRIKIFLQNGKFYIERTEREDLAEDFIPYVKKIGEYHGEK